MIDKLLISSNLEFVGVYFVVAVVDLFDSFRHIIIGFVHFVPYKHCIIDHPRMRHAVYRRIDSK